jgi:hypothetical protein
MKASNSGGSYAFDIELPPVGWQLFALGDAPSD